MPRVTDTRGTFILKGALLTRSRKRKLQRITARWAGLPLTSAVLAAGNFARAEPTETGVLDEVVVTAQKRSEDLQKVPISLQVIGAEKLEQLQVASFDDYAKFLPSVSFQSLGPGQAQLYFRGISSGADGLHAGSLPATGQYLDETPVTTIGGSPDVHVYDIARVEALSGPQGTLYGASSLSGTLRVITNKPDATKFSAGYDLKGDKYGRGAVGGTFEGFLNIPLTDRMAVRLVGYYQHDGGYINNVPVANVYQRGDTSGNVFPLTVDNAAVVRDRQNTVDNSGGCAALKVDLNDQWSFTPTVLAQRQNAHGNFAFDPKLGDLNVGDFRKGENLDRWYMATMTVNGRVSNFDLLYSGSWFERKVDNLTDYSQYTVAYDAIGAAYTHFTDANGNLIDPTQYVSNHDKYTKMSHEIRVSSPADQRLRVVMGGFYQRQTDDIRAEFRVDNLGTFWQVDGQPNVLYLSQQDRADRDYALFSDLTVDISEKLKISGGIRKFWVKNTLYGFFGYNLNLSSAGEAACFTPISSNTNRPCVNTDKKVVENGETHKINITYQIDPDHMLYGTYSTGFRPGGNNRRVEALTYAADTLTNFELGWKTAWFDHRLRVNGALFYERWKEAQVAIQGQNGITSIVNAGDAEVKGIESDVSWLPVDDLTISGSGTFLFKAKTTTDFCKPTPVGQAITTCAASGLDAAAGTRLPVTPNLKLNATARYKFNVGAYGSFAQMSIVHQGGTTYSLEPGPNALVGDTPGFTTFDLSVGTARNSWNLEAYVENVFDKRGELGRVSECPADYCYQNTRVYPIKPMNFGVKFAQKF